MSLLRNTWVTLEQKITTNLVKQTTGFLLPESPEMETIKVYETWSKRPLLVETFEKNRIYEMCESLKQGLVVVLKDIGKAESYLVEQTLCNHIPKVYMCKGKRTLASKSLKSSLLRH